jgi:hypothetical protein
LSTSLLFEHGAFGVFISEWSNSWLNHHISQMSLAGTHLLMSLLLLLLLLLLPPPTGAGGLEIKAALQAFNTPTIQGREDGLRAKVQTGKYLTFVPDRAGFNNNHMHFETMLALAVVHKRQLVIPAPHSIDHLPASYHDSLVFDMDVMVKEAGVITEEAFTAKMGCAPLRYISKLTPGVGSNPPTDPVDLMAAHRKMQNSEACKGVEVLLPLTSKNRIASLRLLEDPVVQAADIWWVDNPTIRITRHECFLDSLQACDRFIASSTVFAALQFRPDLVEAASKELLRLGFTEAGTYDAFQWCVPGSNVCMGRDMWFLNNCTHGVWRDEMYAWRSEASRAPTSLLPRLPFLFSRFPIQEDGRLQVVWDGRSPVEAIL